MPHHLRLLIAAAAAVMACGACPAADLRGHGGPVRAIAIARDGDTVLTASFDSTAIVWSLGRSAALKVLRGHEGAVNAAISLGGDRFATAGEDGRILVWQGLADKPAQVLAGHTGPVAALAVSPDRTILASASWDGTARLWPLAGGPARLLEGHAGNVNAVAFLADGRVATGSYDGMLRLFAPDGAPRGQIGLGVPVSAIAVAPDDEIIAVGADGKLRLVSAAREGVTDTIEIAESPLVALALSPDGGMIATAGFRGALALVDRRGRRVVRRLEGPAFPLWSLAFSPDGKEILTGGADRLVRRWSVATGEPSTPALTVPDEDIPPRLKDHPGAAVFRACVACHTLTPDAGNRAGPTLAGLYGRRIATAPGYDFSNALKALEIVWTPETVSRLFEIGPNAYTPGTKMPEQKIPRVEDRRALTEFLDLAGRAR